MYFVLTCCLLAIFLAYLDSKGSLKNGLRIGFAIITLVSALRYNYGSDYLSYIDDFKEASYYTILDYISFNENIRESGWFLLIKLFEPLGPYVFFSFLAIVTSFIYYDFIKENVKKEDYWIALAIYLLNFDLFVLQQSMMRQAFAMALFVWGFHYIKEINQSLYSSDNYFSARCTPKKKRILRPLLGLSLLLSFAIFIHQSSMVLIPVSLIAFIPIRKGKVVASVLFVAFCLLWLSSNYVAPIFEQLMAVEAVAFYGEKYMSDDGVQFGVRQMLSLVPFFVSLYYLWSKNISPVNKPLVVISMFGVLVLPFAGLLQLISRIAYYFDAFAVAAYPIVYRNINNKYIRYLLIALFLLIYIYTWIDKSKNPVWGGKFIEYHTLFELL